MAQAWPAVIVEIPAEAEEALVGAAAALVHGVRVEPAGPDAIRVALYLDASGDPAPVLAAVGAALARLGVEGAPRVESVEDGRWVERYQASLAPFPIGTRFVVHPTGVGGPLDGREPLLLVPGRAFGTGEHPTTRMAVDELERRVRPGSRWLDVGCGSGILALVAARGGAGTVLAVDTDPEAVSVAREVLAANGGPSCIEVTVGSIDAVEAGTWDGVVCNISAPFFEEGGRDVAALPAPGGVLVATGFPDDRTDAVVASLAEGGLAEVSRRAEAPWGLAVLRRPPAAG